MAESSTPSALVQWPSEEDCEVQAAADLVVVLASASTSTSASASFTSLILVASVEVDLLLHEGDVFGRSWRGLGEGSS